jgi:hypothetical protein
MYANLHITLFIRIFVKKPVNRKPLIFVRMRSKLYDYVHFIY